MFLQSYIQRIDTNALHASFINANSKGRRHSVRTLLGDRPILSDEKPSAVAMQQMKEAFKRIFPKQEGVIGERKRKKKARPEVSE